MSFQRCQFLLYNFLLVGVAKRDVIRGIEGDKSIPLHGEMTRLETFRV